jgi:hypothetical protein
VPPEVVPPEVLELVVVMVPEEVPPVLVPPVVLVLLELVLLDVPPSTSGTCEVPPQAIARRVTELKVRTKRRMEVA